MAKRGSHMTGNIAMGVLIIKLLQGCNNLVEQPGNMVAKTLVTRLSFRFDSEEELKNTHTLHIMYSMAHTEYTEIVGGD